MAGKYSGPPKDYIMVHERIQAFYSEFPAGSIQTEIVEMGKKTPPGSEVEVEYILIKAYAYRYPEDPRPGTGHAYEINTGEEAGKNYINFASMTENGETSAVGRALANLGMLVKEGIASREEIDRAKSRSKFLEAESDEAMKQSAVKRKAELALFTSIKEHHDELGVSDSDDAKRELLKESGVATTFRNLTPEQYAAYDEFLVAQIDERAIAAAELETLEQEKS